MTLYMKRSCGFIFAHIAVVTIKYEPTCEPMSTSTPRCSHRLPASQLVSEAKRQAWQAAMCS